jgi:resuscitation-promoting factor RpfA
MSAPDGHAERPKVEGSSPSFFADWAENPPQARTAIDVVREPRQRPWRTRWVAWAAVVATAASIGLVVLPSGANADPSPNDWLRLRKCESGDDYQINSGNGYYGAYQFSLSTWKSVGGKGFPSDASPGEQDARALILYRERGWEPWTCAKILGLKADADAGSGRISDIHVPTTAPTPGASTSTTAPPYPGAGSYQFGDDNSTIKAFQNRMHARGFFPVGTGQFGPLTLTMVKRLQSLNGLTPAGILGPQTWALAWLGKYSDPSSTPSATPTPKPPVVVPAFPGKHAYVYGDDSVNIKTFQNEMHARGFFPVGTGQYGPLTLAMVKRLQSLNGLTPTGGIGPTTWRMAWVGKYSKP